MLDKTAATNINLAPNRQHLPASLWTDEKIARLKEMRAAGSSYSKIGNALGFTRGAISGKVDRLGLDKRARAPKRADGGAFARRLRGKSGANKDRAATQRIAKVVKIRTVNMSPNGGVMLAEKVIREPDPDLEEFNAAIPQEQRRTLLQLTGTTCRWPCGEVEAPSFFFCGATVPEKNTYCAFHFKIAHAPPRLRIERPYLPTGGTKPAVF